MGVQGHFHPPTATLELQNPQLLPEPKPLSVLFPIADHAEAPASALPSEAAPGAAAAFIHKVRPFPCSDCPGVALNMLKAADGDEHIVTALSADAAAVTLSMRTSQCSDVVKLPTLCSTPAERCG